MEDGQIPRVLLYSELVLHADTNQATKTSARELRPEGLERRPEHLGSCSLRTIDLETDGAERPLQATSAQQFEAKRLTRKAQRLADRPASGFSPVLSMEGTVTPALACPATLDAVPESQLHSLLRLTDA